MYLVCRNGHKYNFDEYSSIAGADLLPVIIIFNSTPQHHPKPVYNTLLNCDLQPHLEITWSLL